MGNINFKAFANVADLPRVQPDVSHEDALALLRLHGVLVIENALDPDILDRIDTELEPWFGAACHGAGPFFGRKTRRFAGLFAKAPSTAELAQHPLVLPLMEAILKGPDPAAPVCDKIELNLTQAIGIEPDEPAQFLHRDEELWPFERNYQVMTNAMWALDDFALDNGATRLIPGSHLWPRDREPTPGEAISAVAPKGSVVIWLGGVLHAGGANTTDLIRRGVVMSYRLGWLASSEKLMLTTPPAVARQLPERVRQLIGYQLHKPNLGWIEGQDPMRWLMGDIGELAPMEDNLTDFHNELLDAVAATPEAFGGYLS